jgi:hypothetical protein
MLIYNTAIYIYIRYVLVVRSPDSSVSIVSYYQLDDRGSIPGREKKDFSSSVCVQTGSAAHSASHAMGTGVLSPGVKHGWGLTLTTDPILCRGQE